VQSKAELLLKSKFFIFFFFYSYFLSFFNPFLQYYCLFRPYMNECNPCVIPKKMLNKVNKNTKIVATVGPACSSMENLKALADAGVNIFRLNFSHSRHNEHLEVIQRITELNEKLGYHIGILADLQGPKLRVGQIENDSLVLAEGDVITLVNKPCIGNREAIYMSYPAFASDVKVGEKVLVDDGKLVFEVKETNGKDTVKLVTLFGGVLSSNKGVNLPNTKISLPSLPEKDLADLDFILTQPVNWIALSFVRSAKDVKELRAKIEAKNHPAKIISKIEKPEAIEKIDKIIKASNAIMVARGDLGIEIPIEQVPVIQKIIVQKCIQRSRPVIVATQMMDSMITNPSPTRAEATDVANAVFDGADAVMLSAETSVGRHPVKVVEAMVRIIQEAEKVFAIGEKRPVPSGNSRTFLSDVVCQQAVHTAESIKAKAIIGMTSSGYTAFKVSSFRPDIQIKTYIFCDKKHMLATLSLVWGVECFYYDRYATTDDTIQDVIECLESSDIVQKGDVVVNTGTMPLSRKHRTNMLKITVIE
jgi:pyruvate kinase